MSLLFLHSYYIFNWCQNHHPKNQGQTLVLSIRFEKIVLLIDMALCQLLGSFMWDFSTVELSKTCLLCFQLLQKDPSKRLGSGPRGSEEIKSHKWFKPINWRKLDAREFQPSFRPEVAGKQCVANFEKHWTDMPLVDSPVASPIASGNLFMGFSYVRPAASFLQRDGSYC